MRRSAQPIPPGLTPVPAVPTTIGLHPATHPPAIHQARTRRNARRPPPAPAWHPSAKRVPPFQRKDRLFCRGQTFTQRGALVRRHIRRAKRARSAPPRLPLRQGPPQVRIVPSRHRPGAPGRQPRRLSGRQLQPARETLRVTSQQGRHAQQTDRPARPAPPAPPAAPNPHPRAAPPPARPAAPSGPGSAPDRAPARMRLISLQTRSADRIAKPVHRRGDRPDSPLHQARHVRSARRNGKSAARADNPRRCAARPRPRSAPAPRPDPPARQRNHASPRRDPARAH